MDSDRLRQNSFHWQAEGGQSSSSNGGGWGLWAPQSWLRILAKPPRQLWGGCSCLNPVPQERHLLVIGTMEMAAGFWTWLRAASFRGCKRGSSQTASGAGEWFALPPQSIPSQPTATSTRSRAGQVKSAANPTGRGKVSGDRRQRRGEEGPKGGGSPRSSFPRRGRTPSSSVRGAPGPGVPGRGWVVSRPSQGAPPYPCH